MKNSWLRVRRLFAKKKYRPPEDLIDTDVGPHNTKGESPLPSPGDDKVFNKSFWRITTSGVIVAGFGVLFALLAGLLC